MKDEEMQKMLRQSDRPVISEKQGNACGEKGPERARMETRETSTGLGTGEWMRTKLASLTERAGRDPKYRFWTLMNLNTEETLTECYEELKRRKAPGIDGVSVEEYGRNLGENIRDLYSRLRAWKYKPQPVRRVYIPKSDGKMRGLGIPAIEDKIVQVWMKKILEAIYEVDFRDVSYGFRPKRGCHEALDSLDKMLMTKPVNYVVDMDVHKFFDSIDHKWMIRCLEERVVDGKFLRLAVRFLKAGVLDDGKLIETEKGTPQGGNLSPILANIYLHYVLDLWFEKRFKKQLKGYAQLVRYADDFVVCFEKQDEAEAFSRELVERLKKFGLTIAEGKSRTVEFGRKAWDRAQNGGGKPGTFSFLGITHYCDKTRRGKFKVGRKTSGERLRQKMKAMNIWLKSVRNAVPLKVWWQVLGQKMRGHYIYYGISGNMRCLRKFYSVCLRLAYKWINRRSQKKSYNWERFKRFLVYNPMPTPKIYHEYSAFA